MQESHPLETSIMDLKEAKASGAIAMFGEKYDDKVRVVNVPGVSKELCGGTHVANTSEIGGFKVISEAGIASGVRRIEAVSGPSLMPYVNSVNSVVRDLTAALKVSVKEVPARVTAMQKELMAKEKQIIALRSEVALARSAALVSKVCAPVLCK
jgi:alanyl-tRNA synthetase